MCLFMRQKWVFFYNVKWWGSLCILVLQPCDLTKPCQTFSIYGQMNVLKWDIFIFQKWWRQLWKQWPQSLRKELLLRCLLQPTREVPMCAFSNPATWPTVTIDQPPVVTCNLLTNISLHKSFGSFYVLLDDVCCLAIKFIWVRCVAKEQVFCCWFKANLVKIR